MIRFEFAFEDRLALWGRLFGVRPDTAWVEVDDSELRVHFGPWRLETTRDNVATAEITGPYAAWKVAGPARLSLADRGLTFGTTTARGVCIRFRHQVPGIEPTRRLGHLALTITVADPERLRSVLIGTEPDVVEPDSPFAPDTASEPKSVTAREALLDASETRTWERDVLPRSSFEQRTSDETVDLTDLP